MKKKPQGFWHQMWPYLKEYRLKIVCCVLCALIVGVFVAIQPLVIKYIVDNGISNPSLNNNQKIQIVLALCLFYILISIARVVIWRFGANRMYHILEGGLFHLRSKFFFHVQQLSMKFYETTSAGELFNCILGTPMANIKNYMSQILMSVPYQMVSLVISLSALLYYDWVLTIILTITALAMAICNKVARKKIREVSREYIKSEAETSKYLTDTLNGIDAVRLYSIEENTFDQMHARLETMFHKSIRASILQHRKSTTPEMIQYLGTAVVYFVGAASCIYRGVSVGVLYAFLSSMGSILNILIAWLNIGLTKSSADAGLDKIAEILSVRSDTPEQTGMEQRNILEERAIAQAEGKPCIQFQNVHFSYSNQAIFEQFNCSIAYGESVALVGSSGCGKSTLSKLAMRLYDVQQGQVLVHGQNIKDYPLHDLRISFGIVPQNPFIFYGSVWDNIKIARPNASNKEMIEAMEIAHVHDFINQLEQGWNTIVGDGGLDLSGGQKQRIAIARAVLGNPDILIFDEATSALDNVSERAISKAMDTLMKKHTVLIIAHRLSTIRHVDRILVMDHGKIVEEGNYTSLSQKEGGQFAQLLQSVE